jgi:hypothetical protein
MSLQDYKDNSTFAICAIIPDAGLVANTIFPGVQAGPYGTGLRIAFGGHIRVKKGWRAELSCDRIV